MPNLVPADSRRALAVRRPRPASTPKAEAGRLTRFLLILATLALLLRSFVVAPFNIPSGSMLPNMLIGDYLFVAKWPFGFSRYSLPFPTPDVAGRLFGRMPERGEVVVFRSPANPDQDFVKRVIGLPGDRVRVAGGALFLNGEEVPRTRIADFPSVVSPNSPCRRTIGGASAIRDREPGLCRFARFRETLPDGRSYEVLDQGAGPGDEMREFQVPEGALFLMGDNRDDSADSRFAPGEGGQGFVPVDNLVGRALVVFFSTDGSAEWLKPRSWIDAARWERLGMRFA